MDLSLKNKEWREFELGKLFNIKRGKRLISLNRKNGILPYFSATSTNNGLTDFINNPLFVEKNKIIVTTFCDAYFIKGSFTASDEITMMSNKMINEYSGKFITRIIVSNQSKYAFGRKAFSERLARQKILLPINSQGEPDYEFMEAYMRQKEQEKINAFKNYITKRINELGEIKNVVPLIEKNWGEFFLNDIFSDIQRGKRLKKDDHIKGKTPYISSTALNNGIDGFVGNKENIRVFSNCLTLANSGSVGACFYQPFESVASDHVTKLENKKFNKHIYLFISTIATRLGEKYSFNREINDLRIRREKIILPVNQNHEPDYEYMENYIKQIELKKLQKYLKYKLDNELIK
jgi:hypothetical protein